MNDDFDSLHDDLLDTEGEVGVNPALQDPGYQPEDEGDDDDDFSATEVRDPNALFSQDDAQDDDDEEGNQHTEDPIQETQLINDLLKTKGITDPTAIKWENEDGEVVDVNFYDLEYQEQLNILQGDDSDIDFGLDTHEVEVVNFLRENEVTFEQAIEYYKRQAVEEYIKEQSTESFEIDSFTDEELYVLDLKTKYDNLTEDELQLELEKEAGNPELFKKKTDKIREEYKALEIQEKESSQQEKLDAENEKFNTLKDSLITAAIATEDIGGIDLDDTEKDQVLAFILDKDVNGVSALDKARENPKLLFEMAWYASKGKEAFQIVHDYYKKQIDSVRKTAYEKGKLESNKSTSTNTEKTNVVKQVSAPARKRNSISIDDLHNI